MGQSSIEHFTQLESAGEMPADFKTLIVSEQNMDKFLRDLFLGGEVLFGTPLNTYINTIADTLLHDYPELRQELRFYILKSPVVNAFATENGIIMVNMGLLAQVTSESDLAFILAHEIVHYVEHHVFTLNDYAKDMKKTDARAFYLNFHNRSRDQELAADKLGLERYYNHSPYSLETLDVTFDVLQYATLPFDEIPFPREFVEKPFYKFPDKYFLQSVTPVDSRENHVDTLSTHPNIQRRRQAVKAIVAGLNHEGRREFVQSEDLFYQMRTLARFECINLYLTEHDYAASLYNSFVLLKQFPQNRFLNSAIAASFYGVAMYRINGNTSDCIKPYKEIQGEQQQVNHFLSKLSRNEATVLAIRFVWQEKVQNPDDTYLDAICKNLMQVLQTKNRMEYNDFSDYSMFETPDSTPINEEKQDSLNPLQGDKYQRIKGNNRLPVIAPTEAFKTVNYMLVDYHRDPAFNEMLTVSLDDYEDNEIHQIVKKDDYTDIGKIIINSPICMVDFKRFSSQKEYNECIKMNDKITKVLHKVSKKLDIEAKLLDEDNMLTYQTEQYNCYVKLKEWIKDYANANETKMIFYQSKDIQKVIDFYGTPYLNIVLATKEQDKYYWRQRTSHLIEMLICPYTAPFAITSLALPIQKAQTHVIILDLRTGDVLVDNTVISYSSINEAYRNSFIYDQFYTIFKTK